MTNPNDADSNFNIQEWHDYKARQIEQWIGKQHEHVLHSIIPFPAGGALDLYHFDLPQQQGTAVVTMELCDAPGRGPCNSSFAGYELAMFTRVPFEPNAAQDKTASAGSDYIRFTTILNTLALHCLQVPVERFDTCEFSAETNELRGSYFVFDAISPESTPNQFGIMVPLEILATEFEFAQQEGGKELVRLLRQNGYHPFSTTNRLPVA
ncbi:MULTISPECIES: hypothetical protein [Rhodopirellula]|uniref:hypothetical protein n=1 Tax=Rhodopirellula TaxID=265488 RepID=UPI00257C380D|nr:hypothetical protein [Rhodopirellula sp. UBA1907]